jgi:mxaC protein
MSVDQPWSLLLLILCLPALYTNRAAASGASSLDLFPSDAASRTLEWLLRSLAACAIAATVLSLAGLHRGAGSIERTGQGAHIVLLLDRSLSMDEGLALTGQTARTSKTAAAVTLIQAFFAKRPHDSFGLVAFSTQPIPIMPITEHREPIASAMAAMRQKGLANTDIGAGLEAALDMFAADDPAASRVILFVSDGAGRIPDSLQAQLRVRMLLERIHLYYLYLRSGDSPALAAHVADRHDMTEPASLDAFFRSLNIPYRGFEASEPEAIADATQAIGQLERHPVIYREPVPRIGYEYLCYGIASACLILVLLARLVERDFAGGKRRA